MSREVPRRLRLSAREIGVAVALTLAAAAQLWVSLGARSDSVTVRSEQAAGSHTPVDRLTAR